ncbi:hypothetical protein [Paraburkholderia sediminicola]|uniref:hypothetical protein n=1 Tax=Paraburkholderia sediminicola TaxID=458836 RepID=UPI0038BDD0CA
MKLERLGEAAAQSAIGIAILIAFCICLMLTFIMGVLLIPYNSARVIAWIFEKLLDALAFIIASIEDRI